MTVDRLGVVPPDPEIVARLRAGDTETFTALVRAWSPTMISVARSFVGSHASAEDAAQEAWLAVLRGIDAFEGRSTLRTWVFSVLVNIARRQGVRESRTVAVEGLQEGDVRPTVDPGRFRPAGEPWAGGWRSDAGPRPWGPEMAVLNRELRERLVDALQDLPLRQRVVIELHDVAGLPAGEVCEILDLSTANQRVLLHRARAKVRQQLEDYHNDRQGEAEREH